jgi:hypothetical protein
MFDLSWGTAIVAGGFFAVGLGSETLGRYLSRQTNSRTAQMLLVWPFVGLGFTFMGLAALTILSNMLSSIIVGVWSLFS